MFYEEENNEIAFESVVHSAILFNKILSPSCLKLFCFIKSLTRLHGYCFATNEYLAKLMNCTDRSVRRYLNELKEEGFLEIETEKNGIQWQRRIFLGVDLKKCLRRDKAVRGGGQSCPGGRTEMSTRKKSIINKIDKEEERGKPAPPPPQLIIFENLQLKKEKYEKLIEKYGKEQVEKVRDTLNNLKDLKPSKFKAYKCHATALEEWIKKDLEWKKERTGGSTSSSANKDFAMKIKEKLAKNDEIEIFGDGIGMGRGAAGSFVIKFSEPAFKEQVENRLRKMGIKLE